MSIFVTLLLAILGTSRHKEVNYASIFAMKDDIWAGGASICLWRTVRPTDHIIAHRTLPCGTVVFIYNPRTHLSTVAAVGDHGPYGACLDNNWKKGAACKRWTVKKREIDPGIWRGGFDFTPSVASAIGQIGIELMEVTIIKIVPTAYFSAKTARLY